MNAEEEAQMLKACDEAFDIWWRNMLHVSKPEQRERFAHRAFEAGWRAKAKERPTSG